MTMNLRTQQLKVYVMFWCGAQKDYDNICCTTQPG